jgi:hypothetical protein
MVLLEPTLFIDGFGDTASFALVHVENSLVHTAGWLEVL